MILFLNITKNKIDNCQCFVHHTDMCMVRLSDITSERKTLVSQIVKSHTEPFTIWCQQDFVKTSKTNVKIGHTFYKVKNMDYIYRILNNKFGKDIREKITSYFIETLNPNNHLSYKRNANLAS